MNHETMATGTGHAPGGRNWETFNPEHSTLNIELGKEDKAAIADRRYIDALDFDCVKASQARSDFIKATIIFFGLDGECPSLSDILSA